MKSCFRERFLPDDSGALTPLMLVLLVGIIVSSGIALDLIRQESERSDLQDALDRGVLAAAALTQAIDPEVTVRDYLKNRSLSDVQLDISVSSGRGNNSRRISASARYEMDTLFFRMVGLPELPVTARTTALQGRQPAEISLVLDISGTMRWDQRLVNLRPAASAFVDAVTDGEADSLTSINLIPYAGQVNPGPAVFAMLNGRRTHDFSSCPEFKPNDFNDTHLPAAPFYEQVPNFHHWRIDRAWMDWGWCPSDDTAITYLSNDRDALRQAISDLRLHDGTGTYNAMKWALALLDPDSQPFVAGLADRGIVPREFDSRPAAWDDPETRKFIVLMTDGIVTEQYRPQHPSDPELATEEILVHGHPFRETLSRPQGLGFFNDLCNMAKANGVTVFTIAFEAPEEAQEEMRNCASSAGHFFDAQGTGIATAFEQIASTINNLKLVE